MTTSHSLSGRSVKRTLALIVASTAVMASALAAQEVAERWMPEELRLPDDMEVLFDRSLDRGYRFFSFRTGANTDNLLTRWRRALEDGGYRTSTAGPTVGEGEFQFTGPGIRKAEVSVTPAEEWSLAVVEIEAALRL